MSYNSREDTIMAMLEKDRIVYTSALVEEMNVSEATVRRDLAKMEKMGKLQRIAGGAVLTKKDNVLTPDDEIYMNHRMNINWDAKKNVARMACDEIRDGECVFLDGGSSIVPMIDILRNRKIRIVTNNHIILGRLGENCQAEVIAVGGQFMNLYSMSIGTEAINMVNNYNYDRCFISCTGFDVAKNMAYLAERYTKGVKDAAIANSKNAYLLVDSSKEGTIGFCKFAELSGFKAVFCDHVNNPEVPANFRTL